MWQKRISDKKKPNQKKQGKSNLGESKVGENIIKGNQLWVNLYIKGRTKKWENLLKKIGMNCMQRFYAFMYDPVIACIMTKE